MRRATISKGFVYLHLHATDKKFLASQKHFSKYQPSISDHLSEAFMFFKGCKTKHNLVLKKRSFS